ncbi:MAG: carbohydrate kinase [Flavobacteriaceae bacterium]|nr:carbohydrate kinase [Flavobacteriaceae bacterium]MDZ4147960.1 carbohydrate kinase [Flavobacteriaceae bacterium]
MNRVANFLCFGEVLFDVLPDKKVVGGASLNVAIWLHRLGNQVSMLSAVGKDELGKELMEFISAQGLNTDLIAINDKFPTSTVNVKLDADGVATYSIEKPVAWDEISLSDAVKKKSECATYLIYNSLTVRSETSRNTLLQLLKNDAYKVLDVNLRPPHYDKETLIELMQAADFIKFNEEEILEIVAYFKSGVQDIREAVLRLSEKTKTYTICVTLGGDGVLLYKDEKFYSFGGFKVIVKDTIGAGDSFLAALLSQLHQQTPIENALRFACTLGALVASKEGAVPEIDLNEINYKMNFEK